MVEYLDWSVDELSRPVFQQMNSPGLFIACCVLQRQTRELILQKLSTVISL